MVGILEDKDRIFTNLYGFHDWGLEGAKHRGCWNATPDMLGMGRDWIIANDVSPATGTFGGDTNTVHLITATGAEDWPAMAKTDVAARLAERIAAHYAPTTEAAE